jgi:hypothetical protein
LGLVKIMSVYAEEERIVYDGIAEEKKDVLGSTSR